MEINIDGLTESELVDLNRRIVERLRLLDQVRAHQTMMQFVIGDRVTFHHGARRTVTGIITRYNKKTVTIVTEDGLQWNVSPSLVKKAENDTHRAKVVDITSAMREAK